MAHDGVGATRFSASGLPIGLSAASLHGLRQPPLIDQLLAGAPYYARATIPGGFYRGSQSDTPTFGVRATLVTTAATPDDVVYFVVNRSSRISKCSRAPTRRSRISTGEKWPRSAHHPTPIRVLSALPQSRADVNEGCDAARTRVSFGSRLKPSARKAVRPIVAAHLPLNRQSTGNLS